MQILHLLLNLLIIVASFLVPFSNNPITSIIFLIITFLNAAFILFFFNVDFLGIIYVIIYVGAIAVLFLFVIMMLNIKSQEFFFLKTTKINKFFTSFTFCYIIFILLFLFFKNFFSKEEYFLITNKLNVVYFVDNFNNIDVLGQVLFNHLNICFLIAGLILLIALIGSIILTLKFTNTSKKQLILKQLARSNNNIIFLDKNI